MSPINVGVYAFTRGISVPRLWLNAMYRWLLEAPQIKRKMFLFLHFREGLPYPVRCHGLPITVVTSLACIFACCLLCSFIQCTRRNNSLQITLLHSVFLYLNRYSVLLPNCITISYLKGAFQKEVWLFYKYTSLCTVGNIN